MQTVSEFKIDAKNSKECKEQLIDFLDSIADDARITLSIKIVNIQSDIQGIISQYKHVHED